MTRSIAPSNGKRSPKWATRKRSVSRIRRANEGVSLGAGASTCLERMSWQRSLDGPVVNGVRSSTNSLDRALKPDAQRAMPNRSSTRASASSPLTSREYSTVKTRKRRLLGTSPSRVSAHDESRGYASWARRNARVRLHTSSAAAGSYASGRFGSTNQCPAFG